MNDWRIGRLIRTINRSFPSAVAASAGIVANTQRVALQISLSAPPILITDSIAQDNPGVVIFVGGVELQMLSAFNPVYKSSLLTHGDLPTLDHVLVNSSYVGVISVTEWVLPEAVLTAAINQFYAENPKWPR